MDLTTVQQNVRSAYAHAVASLGFHSSDDFESVFYGRISFQQDTEIRYNDDGSFVVIQFGHSYRFSAGGVDLDQLRACITEMTILGTANEVLSKYSCASAPDSIQRGKISITSALMEVVARVGLPMLPNPPLWHHLAMNNRCKNSEFTDQPLHVAYLYAGIVRLPGTTCSQYDCLLTYLNDPEFNKYRSVGPAGQLMSRSNNESVRSFASFVGNELGISIVVDDPTPWFAVMYDNATSPMASHDVRTVMAMHGDYLLKTAACQYHMKNQITPKALSAILTTRHSNAHMSFAFSRSEIAKHVVTGSGIDVSGGKVGATFLEALASVLYGYGGVPTVLLCLQYFNLLESS